MASNLSLGLWIDLARDAPGAYRRLMRKYPRVSVLVLAALAVFALSGCFAAAPVEPPASSPSAAPVFASEEEALAAATEAYAAYLAVSDQVANDGGVDLNRLKTHVSVEYFEEQKASYSELLDAGLRTSGSTTFQPPKLQSLEQNDRAALMTIYVCVDVTTVRVLDEASADVTPITRPDQYPLVVEIEGTKASQLLLRSSLPWAGESFCAAN